MANAIDLLRLQLPHLSRQEAVGARAILAEPEKVLHQSLAQVAESAGISQPTVIRLCRSIGLTGFTELKLSLARGLAPGTPYVSATLQEGDPAAVYVPQLFDAALHALQSARNALDVQAVERAVDALSAARRVLLFGLGGSASVATDAQHKLSRFPFICQSTSDPVLARMQVLALTPADVLVLISNTGRTTEVLELAELAASTGVLRVALTAPASPLAERSDLLIGIQPAEDTERYFPAASRLTHLTLIDVLATGIALKRGSALQPHLARVKAALRDTRCPDDLCS